MDTNIATQSHDVTVGEVDATNIPDSPKTGFFGLEAYQSAAITISTIIVPIVILSIYLAKRICRK